MSLPHLSPDLVIVLIDDEEHNSKQFAQIIRERYGIATLIEEFASVSEALSFLESREPVDQIWLDRSIPGLRSPSALAQAITALSRHVLERGEVRILSGDPAELRGVAPVVDPSQYNHILEIVGMALARKTSGRTTEVSNARLEGRLAKLEYQIEQIEKLVGKIEGSLVVLAEAPFFKASINETAQLAKTLQLQVVELKKTTSDLDVRLKERQGVSKEAIAVIGTILAAGITGFFALANTIAPQIAGHLFGRPSVEQKK